MDTVIKGNIVDIIYDNPETGYRILAVATENDVVTVRGTMATVFVGAEITATGTWTVHPMYGEQLQARDVAIEMPTSKGGIRAFLQSGLIPGIGPETAKKIVKKFGDETMDVIENDPIRLAEISGLSERKIRAICDAVAEHKGSSQTIMFFSQLGVGSSLALKAYRIYGKDTETIVRDNPYRLADEIDGFGFKTSDRIALQLGTPQDDINRITSCIIFVLKEQYVAGHCYLPSDVLYQELSKYVETDTETFSNALDRLEEARKTVSIYNDGNRLVYQKYIYDAERGIERMLKTIHETRIKASRKNIIASIEKFESQNDL